MQIPSRSINSSFCSRFVFHYKFKNTSSECTNSLPEGEWKHGCQESTRQTCRQRRGKLILHLFALCLSRSLVRRKATPSSNPESPEAIGVYSPSGKPNIPSLLYLGSGSRYSRKPKLITGGSTCCKVSARSRQNARVGGIFFLTVLGWKMVFLSKQKY